MTYLCVYKVLSCRNIRCVRYAKKWWIRHAFCVLCL